MLEKIIAWITLILTLTILLVQLIEPSQESWLLVIVYFVMVAYIVARYIEKLGK